MEGTHQPGCKCSAQGDSFWQVLFLHPEQVSFIKGLMLHKTQHSRVSFCDGSFYDDSLLRPLSSRTEHSRLAVHHCRNSSVLSLLSALLVLFRCARVSSFSILVQFFWVDCDFSNPRRPSKRQKRRNNQNSWHYILSWCLLNHRLGLFQQNKKWFDWYFFQLSV